MDKARDKAQPEPVRERGVLQRQQKRYDGNQGKTRLSDFRESKRVSSRPLAAAA